MTATYSVKGQSSILSRAALLLYVAAQLCIGLVAATEGRFGADARSHVEAAGTSVHHAHDEAGCAACSARALLAIGGDASRPGLGSASSQSIASFQIDTRHDISTRSNARPRAPPLRQA